MDSPRPHVTYELLPFDRDFGRGLDILPVHTNIAITTTSAPKLNGNFSTLERTAEAFERGFEHVVPHISARAIESYADFESIVEQIEDLGIEDIFVVGGDSQYDKDLPYPDGAALLEAFAERGLEFESVGVPAYPRGHHDSEINNKLRDDLRRKISLMRELTSDFYIETQFEFSADELISWLVSGQRSDITIPVQVGLFGAVGFEKGFRAMCLNGGVKKANEFMKKTGLTKIGFMRGQHIQQTQEVADAIKSRKDLHIRGFTINTLNEVSQTLHKIQV